MVTQGSTGSTQSIALGPGRPKDLSRTAFLLGMPAGCCLGQDSFGLIQLLQAMMRSIGLTIAFLGISLASPVFAEDESAARAGFEALAPEAQPVKPQSSVWLIIHKGWAEDAALEKIEMRDMQQCEMQGAIWISSTRIEKDSRAKYNGFECLEGK